MLIGITEYKEEMAIIKRESAGFMASNKKGRIGISAKVIKMVVNTCNPGILGD